MKPNRFNEKPLNPVPFGTGPIQTASTIEGDQRREADAGELPDNNDEAESRGAALAGLLVA